MSENIMPFHEVEVDEENKPNKECDGYIVFSCMTCAFKVLLNLTHDNSKYNPDSAKLTPETQLKAQAQTQFKFSCNSA